MAASDGADAVVAAKLQKQLEYYFSDSNLRRDAHLRGLAGAERRQARIDHYSINISGQSITDEQFVDFARDCIERSGVDPGRLVFEITETAALEDFDVTARFISNVRDLGCKVALDDFGSGYTSFRHMKSLTVDVVKIDGAWIPSWTSWQTPESLFNTVKKKLPLGPGATRHNNLCRDAIK